MDDLPEFWQRLRWARLRAGFERAADAAASLNIKSGTYRTYERPKEDGGREPSLNEKQRLARKFKVRWEWLAAGQGAPKDGVQRVPALDEAVEQLPDEKREDAIRAAVSVLRSFRN